MYIAAMTWWGEALRCGNGRLRLLPQSAGFASNVSEVQYMRTSSTAQRSHPVAQ